MRAYKLGKFLAEHYKSFFDPIYTSDMLHAQSTDVHRTKSTLQLVLAGLLPPILSQVWNDELLWQPIPISYTPLKLDSFLLGKECKRWVKNDDIFTLESNDDPSQTPRGIFQGHPIASGVEGNAGEIRGPGEFPGKVVREEGNVPLRHVGLLPGIFVEIEFWFTIARLGTWLFPRWIAVEWDSVLPRRSELQPSIEEAQRRWISKRDRIPNEKHFLLFSYVRKQRRYRGFAGAPIRERDNCRTTVVARSYWRVGKSSISRVFLGVENWEIYHFSRDGVGNPEDWLFF